MPYKLMAAIKPDGVPVLGDTNSWLSVIGMNRSVFMTITVCR